MKYDIISSDEANYILIKRFLDIQNRKSKDRGNLETMGTAAKTGRVRNVGKKIQSVLRRVRGR